MAVPTMISQGQGCVIDQAIAPTGYHLLDLELA